MKILLESNAPRKITNDPMEFFTMNRIKNGWTVAVGYLMTPDETKLTFGPKGRKSNIAANDAQLAEYIEKYSDRPWAAKFQAIRETPKYQAALESGKTCPFDLGDCVIIKIGRYNINWRDKAANAKDWERRANQELEIRRKYGFGRDEADYPEDDWHRKPSYGGVGVRRQISGNRGISRYQDQGDHDTLYTHIDNNGKIAIRQQLAQSKGNKSVWYFVDENGMMSEMPNDFIYFLMNAYKAIKTSEGSVNLAELAQEEKDFIAELKAYNERQNKEIKTLLLDRMLYMVATAVDLQGQHVPVAYINDKSIYDAYPYLNKSEMNRVIAPWLKRSSIDLL